MASFVLYLQNYVHISKLVVLASNNLCSWLIYVVHSYACTLLLSVNVGSSYFTPFYWLSLLYYYIYVVCVCVCSGWLLRPRARLVETSPPAYITGTKRGTWKNDHHLIIILSPCAALV
jgi:hypothetical protein